MAQTSMISNFFITIGSFIFVALLAILPDSTGLPATLEDAIAYIGSALNAVSYLLPVGSFFTAIGIVVLYEATIWSYHGILWAWKKLPFIGK